MRFRQVGERETTVRKVPRYVFDPYQLLLWTYWPHTWADILRSERLRYVRCGNFHVRRNEIRYLSPEIHMVCAGPFDGALKGIHAMPIQPLLEYDIVPFGPFSKIG